MIITKVEYGDRLDNIYKNIPAYMENGVLVLGHNGVSLDHSKYYDIPENHNVNDFKYFADHIYRGSTQSNPHFLYKGKIPYELMKVFSGNYYSRKLLYTYLTPCREETYFCKCNDCGKNFIIDCYEVPFFKSKGLIVPTVRCKGCIKNRKNRK